MIKGFVTGFLMAGGDLRVGLLGALGAGLFAGTHFLQGKWALNAFQHAVLKGVAAGALASIAGGRFATGFLGAFAGGLLGESIGDKLGGGTGEGGLGERIGSSKHPAAPS